RTSFGAITISCSRTLAAGSWARLSTRRSRAPLLSGNTANHCMGTSRVNPPEGKLTGWPEAIFHCPGQIGSDWADSMKDFQGRMLKITISPFAHGTLESRYFFVRALWRYTTTGPDFRSKIIAEGRGYTARPSHCSGRSMATGMSG